jgi:hypothetical protein
MSFSGLQRETGISSDLLAGAAPGLDFGSARATISVSHPRLHLVP